MNIKRLLADGFAKAVGAACETAERTARDRHNVDIVCSWSLQRLNGRNEIHFPVDYVELLRSCMEKKWLKLELIKTDSHKSGDLSAARFSGLLDALRQVPPIEFSVAEKIALIADDFRNNLQPIEGNTWAGDVRLTFDMASSFGTKGRILSAIVQCTRSDRCLELGTAYGMSAVYILEALTARGTEGHLTTLEAGELPFSLSSKMLKERYGSRVSCEFGWTQQALASIAASVEPVEFLFHDAGHSREDYVRDFATLLPVFAPGAVVLIDDIRWEDRRFYQGNPRCYEGWMELVNHPRARRAVEINDSMGLLLLSD